MDMGLPNHERMNFWQQLPVYWNANRDNYKPAPPIVFKDELWFSKLTKKYSNKANYTHLTENKLRLFEFPASENALTNQRRLSEIHNKKQPKQIVEKLYATQKAKYFPHFV